MFRSLDSLFSQAGSACPASHLPAAFLEEGKLQGCTFQYCQGCYSDGPAGLAGKGALHANFMPVRVELADVHRVKIPGKGRQTAIRPSSSRHHHQDCTSPHRWKLEKWSVQGVTILLLLQDASEKSFFTTMEWQRVGQGQAMTLGQTICQCTGMRVYIGKPGHKKNAEVPIPRLALRWLWGNVLPASTAHNNYHRKEIKIATNWAFSHSRIWEIILIKLKFKRNET